MFAYLINNLYVLLGGYSPTTQMRRQLSIKCCQIGRGEIVDCVCVASCPPD